MNWIKRLKRKRMNSRRVKRNKYGIPIKKKDRPNWITRNRSVIELGIIIALFLTGSTTLACVMLTLYIVDTM